MEAAAAGLRARAGRGGLRRTSDGDGQPRVRGPVPPRGRRLAERRRPVPLDRDERRRPARRRVLRVRGEARGRRGAGHPARGLPVDPGGPARDGEPAGVLDARRHRDAGRDPQRLDRVQPGVRAVGHGPDPGERHRARDGRRRRHVPRGLGFGRGSVLRDRLPRPGDHDAGRGHAGDEDPRLRPVDRSRRRRPGDRLLHVDLVRRQGAARDAERRHVVERHDRRGRGVRHVPDRRDRRRHGRRSRTRRAARASRSRRTTARTGS